jgi:hypothetical protein
LAGSLVLTPARGLSGDMCQATLVNEPDLEQRVAAAWASIDQRSEAEFLALIENLAAQLPPDSGIGAFERASAFDSTGHPDLAVPLGAACLCLRTSVLRSLDPSAY